MPSLAELKELQNECLADDVDVPPEATAWTENEARAFFESGGTVRPGSEPAAPSGSSDASAEEDYMMIRWAVDTSAWEPGEDEWRVLLETLPEEDATRVMKFHFKDDQKRALVSRLLQRRACAGFLSCSHSEVTIHRTKGRKPYLATAPDGGAAGGGPAAGGVDAAPNWNFNVSHEGSFVILASEPALLCGVDVAAPGQLRRGRDRGLKELFHTMRDNFTEHEWQQVHSAGPADPPMEMTFRKLWSLKEAYTKARGDGLGFPFKRCEFTLGGTHPAAPARAAHTAGGAPPAADTAGEAPAAADTAGGAAATASAGEERADGGAAARGIPAAPPPTGASKRGLISALCLLLKKEKVRDAAVVSLGQITAGEPDAAFRNQALQALFGMASTKDIELQLSVGQALARLASASPAGSAAPPPPPKIEPPERPAIPSELATLPERAAAAAAASTVGKGDRLLAYVLARVLLQHAVAWAPLERQAAAAWLLAILRAAATAGSQTDVRASAGAIQGVLVGLLADAHEATQELASKGLSALFDCCDEASRKTILSQLVSGLHTTRGANASASGGEMSTYRELSEIAANVGQPQLVYKLMECAASSAVWNTRKGVAFALAEHSREALDEHLPSLLPSLYRHTHDPNPRVAGAMRQLWASLVPDPKQALTAHLQPVLRHLCDSLGDRLWRAREGACLALAELLPGRTHAELAPMLSELHTKLLRTLDDIKETVRAAAEAAWRALCSACVRLTDGAKATEAEAGAVLAVVLPALLDGGVLNASAEVRAACTRQLLKLVQGAGPHLASHTPRLVPFLVESLSSLEDPSLLYMQHHVPGLGVSAGAFEHARVAANRGSPAAAALQQCLRVMSDEHVAAVLPPLTDTLARGTGLPSRAGAAHTVMQLAQAHPVAVAPHAGRTLAVLARAIPDERSVAARRAYTSAAAQLARLTKPEPLGDMLKAFADRYATGAVTTNEEGERLVLATLVRELGRGAPDAMAGLQADWLPLAYVGRHEPRWESEADEPGRPAGQLASVWEEAYDEGGGGPGAAAAHLPELLELLARLVDGQSWALRRAAAAALMELAAQGGGALASRPDAAPAMAALAAKLREHSRRWVDKEALLPKLDAVLPPPDDPPAATMEAEPTSGDF
mmetsp:Transcript_1566/g.5053  ORF Transcript_1566/g.5053 Transcript_1566/m.5053 type:complete len:1137 (-) Transcript_1566:498-3908(-)